MKLLGWLILYAVALLLEISFLPSFFGGAVLSLTTAVFLIGIALADFRSGFWLAGLSGIARDILAPPDAAAHTLFFLSLFLAIHFFSAVAQWDEPARRIGAAGAGLAAWPLVWIFSSAAGRVFLGITPPSLDWPDFASAVAFREFFFAAVWFSVFSWLVIHFAARQRLKKLERLW